MPLYLVRWPDLSASLVRAENEEHLLDILDQEANPEGCEWSEYDGPLAINFQLPARWSIKDERPGEPTAPSQVVIEDVGPMISRHLVESLEVSLAGGDEGHDMGEAILEKAFPRLQAAAEQFRSSEEAAEADFLLPEADRKALHAEAIATRDHRQPLAQPPPRRLPRGNRRRERPILAAEALARADLLRAQATRR
jgi:hypothetical protein